RDITVIYYSSKQITVLIDSAKVLIPTITGFAVLAASGVGFLYKQGQTYSKTIQLGALSVSVAVVLALACWIITLATMVDCSRPFDRAAESMAATLSAHDMRYLHESWATGLAAAKLGTVFLFLAVDIALLVATSIFGNLAYFGAGGGSID